MVTITMLMKNVLQNGSDLGVMVENIVNLVRTTTKVCFMGLYIKASLLDAMTHF